MRTDLYPFEVALCDLLRVDGRTTSPVSAEAWPAVLQLAEREGVTPLVHAAISSTHARGSAEEIPQSVRASLGQSYEYAKAAGEEAYRQLSEVLSALNSAGAAAILLKGIALARFAYGNAALRPVSDLDLLVQQDDVAAAHQALVGAGYAIVGGVPAAADLTWRHARGYFDPRHRRMTVDLHWRYSGYPLLLESAGTGVFMRAQPVEVNGQRALIPAPEDMLVALGIHFARDLWYGKPRLRYLRDAAEVTRRNPQAYGRLIKTARQTPLARCALYVTLGAARELLGAPFPADVLEQLKPRRGWMADRLMARIRRNVMRQERPVEAFLQIAMMRWIDAPSVLAYGRWLGGLLFVPSGLAASQRRWMRGFWGRRRPGAEWGG